MIDIVMILCVSGRFVHICENLPSARKTSSQQDFTVCIGSKKTDLCISLRKRKGGYLRGIALMEYFDSIPRKNWLLGIDDPVEG